MTTYITILAEGQIDIRRVYSHDPGVLFLVADEPPFYGHRGPRVEPEVNRQLALYALAPAAEAEPEPSPREVAKARALAVFGPKRGRWA